MHSILLSRAPLAALILGVASAQNLSAAIVGCSEVGCPVKEGTTAGDCKLIDETFNEIGLARIPIDAGSGELAGISWVQGNSVTDVGGSDERYPTERVLGRSWYLGTPAGFALRGSGGGARACAAFFHKTAAEFPGGNTEHAEGTCEEAMDPGCVAALLRRARSLQYDDDDDDDDVCGRLEEDLNENFDQECREVAVSPYWRNVSVKPILGGSAPAVILSSDNLTSNCWPITPKEDDLAFIERRETTVQTDDFGVDVLQNFFYGVTPILTVFYDGQDTPITTNAAQMTCLKTMGPSPGSNRTDDDDDDDEDDVEDAATFIRGSSAIALFVAAFAVLSSIVL